MWYSFTETCPFTENVNDLNSNWRTNKHHLAAMNLSTHGNKVCGHANTHLTSRESNKPNSEPIRLK